MRRPKFLDVLLILYMLGLLVMILTLQAQARPPVPPSLYKAVRSYWKSKTDRIVAFNVAFCESKFNAKAISPTGDYGYFQVNRQAHDSWVDFGPRIFNPFYNAFVARRLYNAGGWYGPWWNSRGCWA